MRNLLSNCLLVCGLLGAFGASADLVTDFKALDSTRKGPFTQNYLQYTRGRASLGSGGTDGCISSGGGGGRAQFQAAFRNAVAQRLEDQDFFVGNLFTTNYYQLTGEFVFGKRCGSHDDDPVGLWQVADQAMPKATSMIRHWILEKHYVEHFPDSALGKGFKLRGISDTANEAQYAEYFFDFYLSSMTDELQFLPAYLLVKESPVGKSASIDKARDLVARTFDYFAVRYCGTNTSRCTPMVKRLYQLRNAVHNQLSVDVIGQIDQFLVDFPSYKKERHTYLQKTQEILRAYYAFNSKKISEQARKGGFAKVVDAADAITRDGVSASNLLVLSQAGAELRSTLKELPNKKVEALITISLISQFVNKELNNMEVIDSKDLLLSLLNSIYMEGFMIGDNWVYFQKKLNDSPDVATAASQLENYLKIGQKTLEKALSPALAQWVQVEPQMEMFIDNVVKSSSLNTASLIAEKVK